VSTPVTDWLIGAVLAASSAAAFSQHVTWCGVILAVLAVATVAVPAVLRRRLAAAERDLG
jgi:hypothetical protein